MVPRWQQPGALWELDSLGHTAGFRRKNPHPTYTPTPEWWIMNSPAHGPVVSPRLPPSLLGWGAAGGGGRGEWEPSSLLTGRPAFQVTRPERPSQSYELTTLKVTTPTQGRAAEKRVHAAWNV